MATRDKSQGFAFVYTNLSKILAERDQESVESVRPVVPPANAQTVNFNKDVVRPTTPVASPVAASTEDVRERTAAINQIKENLDRLQTLHHKLHAMLAELNGITDKKKR